MNKDHIVHLSEALDRRSCQSLIDIFESLSEYHEDGTIGGIRRVDYDSKKCTEMMLKSVSYTHLTLPTTPYV